MVARPKTTRSIRKKLLPCSVVVCSHKPLSIPPRCVPPVTCSGAACLWPHKRAELLAHVQNTNSQYTLPVIGKKIAYKANRDGVAERFADPAVHKSIEVDLALITYDDELLRDVELSILKTARHHDANTLYLLQTVPRYRQDSPPRAAV